MRLPGGSIWQFRFAKEFCNVARPAGTNRNQLPDLLRGWFGPGAGQPGTAFEVRFKTSPDGLWIEPVQTRINIASRHSVIAYPDLRAAAGRITEDVESPDADAIWLPIDNSSPDLFAVRVSGSSMDGGRQPLHDGDWAVMRVSRGQMASSLENRVVLVQVHRGDLGAGYQIKRLRRKGTGWLLTSDNPAGPTIEAGDQMVAIARLEQVISPTDLAPPNGTIIDETELASRFGLNKLEPKSGRHEGHLFIFVMEKGHLPEPDRVIFTAVIPHPGETAFVLARRTDGGWRYIGIGRRTDQDGDWTIPDVDLATWRAYGADGRVSRRLPEGATARAELIVDALLNKPESDRWIQRSEGNRARVLGRAGRGGIRLDGGEGGFAERTVSLIDLAWVIVASDEVAQQGGVLDEARVNHVRYLEGVPKESTRWIDTGWAIAAWLSTNSSK